MSRTLKSLFLAGLLSLSPSLLMGSEKPPQKTADERNIANIEAILEGRLAEPVSTQASQDNPPIKLEPVAPAPLPQWPNNLPINQAPSNNQPASVEPQKKAGFWSSWFGSGSKEANLPIGGIKTNTGFQNPGMHTLGEQERQQLALKVMEEHFKQEQQNKPQANPLGAYGDYTPSPSKTTPIQSAQPAPAAPTSSKTTPEASSNPTAPSAPEKSPAPSEPATKNTTPDAPANNGFNASANNDQSTSNLDVSNSAPSTSQPQQPDAFDAWKQKPQPEPFKLSTSQSFAMGVVAEILSQPSPRPSQPSSSLSEALPTIRTVNWPSEPFGYHKKTWYPSIDMPERGPRVYFSVNEALWDLGIQATVAALKGSFILARGPYSQTYYNERNTNHLPSIDDALKSDGASSSSSCGAGASKVINQNPMPKLPTGFAYNGPAFKVCTPEIRKQLSSLPASKNHLPHMSLWKPSKEVQAFLNKPGTEQAQILAEVGVMTGMYYAGIGSARYIPYVCRAFAAGSRSFIAGTLMRMAIERGTLETIGRYTMSSEAASVIRKFISEGKIFDIQEYLIREGIAYSTCGIPVVRAIDRMGGPASSVITNIENAAVSMFGSPHVMNEVEAQTEKMLHNTARTVQMAREKFKDLPSAFAKEGAIDRLSRCKADDLATIRGSIYELETALKLEQSGEKVIALGEKAYIYSPITEKVVRSLEADIVTVTKVVESKCWDWSKMTPNVLDAQIKAFQNSAMKTKHYADCIKKIPEMHSKWPMPNSLKEWLVKKGISFCEG